MIVRHNITGKEITCDKAIRGDNYVHLLDAANNMFVAFENVTNFNAFTLTGGEWTYASNTDDCNIAVVGEDGVVRQSSKKCCDVATYEETLKLFFEELLPLTQPGANVSKAVYTFSTGGSATLYANGWLVLDGPGSPDPVTETGNAKWQEHLGDIVAVSVNDTISTPCDLSNFFAQATNLRSVTSLPSTTESMNHTFADCWALVAVPKLPSSLQSMRYAFLGCESLVEAPYIPDNITDMTGAFAGCTKLRSVPYMPSTDSAVTLASAFSGCESLVELPGTLPELSADISYIFRGCKSLKRVPTLPRGATDLSSAFEGCFSIVDAPTLPSEAINLSSAFKDCVSLKNAPSIPESAMWLSSMFQGCTALKAAPAIPGTVTGLYQTFMDCKSMTTPPPIVPRSVVNMQMAFMDCESLSGEITVDADIRIEDTSCWDYCFTNCATAPGAKLIVNYTEHTKKIIDDLIATAKEFNTSSNVVKGSLVTL